VTGVDQERIKGMYKNGVAIRQIARDFKDVCSRRTIQFILFPERRERARQQNKLWREKNGNPLQRYGKEKWRQTVKAYRRYKFSILNKYEKLRS
jgi:hypothetical protein